MSEAPQIELPRYEGPSHIWALTIERIERRADLNIDGHNACLLHFDDKAYAPVEYKVVDLPTNAKPGWYYAIVPGVGSCLMGPTDFNLHYGVIKIQDRGPILREDGSDQKIQVSELQDPEKFEAFSAASEPTILEKVILDVIAEINNQRQKWGEQNHDPSFYLNILMEEVGEASKEIVDATFAEGADNIQKHLNQYRTEVVQVAAVATSMVESYDRNL